MSIRKINIYQVQYYFYVWKFFFRFLILFTIMLIPFGGVFVNSSSWENIRKKSLEFSTKIIIFYYIDIEQNRGVQPKLVSEPQISFSPWIGPLSVKNPKKNGQFGQLKNVSGPQVGRPWSRNSFSWKSVVFCLFYKSC